jgi:hypothetical protein
MSLSGWICGWCHSGGPGSIPGQTYDLCGKVPFSVTLCPGHVTSTAFLPPCLLYLLELLHYYIIACIYYISMPAAISCVSPVSCTIFLHYPFHFVYYILTCITTFELPYGSAFMKINAASSRKNLQLHCIVRQKK